MRVLDFMQANPLLLRLRILLRHLLLAVQIPVGTGSPLRAPNPMGTAGPPPRAQDANGYCRTSIMTSRLQYALPGLNRDFQIAVATTGPQPRLPDRSGHCQTSTATSRSQWALPDLNRDFQIATDTAGPQREEWEKKIPKKISEDIPDRISKDISDRISKNISDRMP